MSLCIPYNETSQVEIIQVYDIMTLRIKENIISYTCVLADVIIHTHITNDKYLYLYDIIMKRLKNRFFVCKKVYGYRAIYLYDRNENILINAWINNLLVLCLLEGT